MKSIAVLFCLLFFVSCHKSEDANGWQELNGNWELRRIEYGYSVQPEILFNADNGNIISFSDDSRYNRTDINNNDTVHTSGTYRITHSITCSSQAVSVIDFSGGYVSNGSILIIAGDSLYFKSDSCVVADGVERTYIRVN